MLVKLIGQLGDKLAECAAQRRVDGPVVDLDALEPTCVYCLQDGIDVLLAKAVIDEQVVDQVIANRAVLVPVGEYGDDGIAGADASCGQAFDLPAIVQHKGAGVQFGDHPLSCLRHLAPGRHVGR